MFLAFAVGIAALGWVSWPLWSRKADVIESEEASAGQAAELASRRTTMYDNIRDLDFEYAMGKLTAEDYRQTRAEMVREAAGVLEELEAVAPDEVLDRWIEQEVAARRQQGGVEGVSCPSCGKDSAARAKFCDHCGVALVARACPSCGAGLRAEARFCSDCGKGT